MTAPEYYTGSIIERRRNDPRAEKVRRTIKNLEHRGYLSDRAARSVNCEAQSLYGELLDLADTSYLQGQNVILKNGFKERILYAFPIACVLSVILLFLSEIVLQFIK